MATNGSISHADNIFVGDAYFEPYAALFGGRRGLITGHPIMHVFGAIPAANDDALFESGSATGSLTLLTNTVGSAFARTTAGYTGGYARNILITSAGDESGKTYTITGTDIHGKTVVEVVTGPNATVVSSDKTFLTVTSIACSDTSAGNMKFGFGNIIGLPYRIANKGQVVPLINGKPASPYTLHAEIAALGTAETRYLLTPRAGVITKLSGIADGAGDTATATVTCKNGKGGSSFGTVAFASNYTAGVIQAGSAITAAARDLAINTVVEVATDGTGGMANRGLISVEIDPALITAADDTTATTTTNDIRGTLNFGGGPDGTNTFAAMLMVDRSTKDLAFGIAQYAG